jgi:Bacterial protein of unknown function (DUF839)
MGKLRTAALVAALAALAVVVTASVAARRSAAADPGFKTAKPAYLIPAAPGVMVDPILSAGDVVGGYQMSGIADGLGAYSNHKGKGHQGKGKDKRVVVVMNHELGRSFPNNPPGVDTRISRLEIDPKTHGVHAAEYLFEGDEGFERFCSATFSWISGRPFYFTGEEAIPQANQPPGPAHDGSSIAMDPDTGMWVETAHFGHFQHENVVPLKLEDWVFLSSEDDFRVGEASYLYAYIADDFKKALRGEDGGLFVWKADNPATNTSFALVKGTPVPGHFVPISQAENANSTALKNASNARNAFRFERLEDIATAAQKGRTYIADTGKAAAGQPTRRGHVYQFDIDPHNPTAATLTMILNGDAPDNDDIVNPDNMDASKKVLVIQEDRESAFRDSPSRVMVYRFDSKTLTEAAHVSKPTPAPRFQWESSGVIDASDLLGKNWWLLDVQAHDQTAPQPGPTLAPNSSTGEDAQLLAIYIPDST